jgi:hypothetical protein
LWQQKDTVVIERVGKAKKNLYVLWQCAGGKFQTSASTTTFFRIIQKYKSRKVLKFLTKGNANILKRKMCSHYIKRKGGVGRIISVGYVAFREIN